MLRAILFFINILCTSVSVMYGADNYKILPLQYDQHSKEAVAIIRENIDLVCEVPKSIAERKIMEDNIPSEFDVHMYNGFIMNSTRIVKNSVQYCVLTDQCNVLKGILSFYIRADDQKGYIEICCTRPRNSKPHIIRMISHTLLELKKKGITAVLVDVREEDPEGLDCYSIQGFVKKIFQPGENKKEGVCVLEYTDINMDINSGNTCTSTANLSNSSITSELADQNEDKNIRPFDYALHNKEVQQMLEENKDFVYPLHQNLHLLGENFGQYEKVLQCIYEKEDAARYNGYTMLSTKILKESVERAVFIDQSIIKGYIVFYIHAPSNTVGCIETLYTSPCNDIQKQRELLQYALNKLREKGAMKVKAQVFEINKNGQMPYTESGFKALSCPQQQSAVVFEYTYKG